MKDKLIPILITALILLGLISAGLWSQIGELEGNEKKEPEIKVVAETEKEIESVNPKATDKKILGAEKQAKILEEPLAVKGEENAPVIIVEFSEYLCPFCAEYAGFDAVPARPIDQGKTLQKIINNYVEQGKVKYIFRDFPVHGQKAKDISQAAYCAGEQEKYWEFHDFLFKNQTKLYESDNLSEDLKKISQELSLNNDQLSACLSSERFTKEIDQNYDLGKNVGVTGTPTFFINGRKLVGAQPYQTFEKIIEEELKK